MKTFLLYALLLTGLSLVSGCSKEEVNPNQLGCLVGVPNNGAPYTIMCVTKKQFEDRNPVVISPDIFTFYKDVQWRLCEDCK
jgi:hypothetical protein